MTNEEAISVLKENLECYDGSYTYGHYEEVKQASLLAITALEAVPRLRECLKWFISQEEDPLPNLPHYGEGIKLVKELLVSTEGLGKGEI